MIPKMTTAQMSTVPTEITSSSGNFINSNRDPELKSISSQPIDDFLHSKEQEELFCVAIEKFGEDAFSITSDGEVYFNCYLQTGIKFG